MVVSVDDVVTRLPERVLPLSDHDKGRVDAFLGDAVDLIRVEFAREGRDFDAELVTVSWLPVAAKFVVREMVAASVIIGPSHGVRSETSNTGPVSDAITYNDDIRGRVSFGGVVLPDDLRARLGLSVQALPGGRFPRAICWPEVRL